MARKKHQGNGAAGADGETWVINRGILALYSASERLLRAKRHAGKQRAAEVAALEEVEKWRTLNNQLRHQTTSGRLSAHRGHIGHKAVPRETASAPDRTSIGGKPRTRGAE